MCTVLEVVDLDAHEPTDDEIWSWYQMMTGPDQLPWEYDESWARAVTSPSKEVAAFRKRRAKQRGSNYPIWAIVDGRVVGMIGINRHDDSARGHCGELGYGVTEEYTRQGIGSRLVAAAIKKARDVGLKRLEVECFDDNVASIALVRKLGFQDEGLRVGAIQKDGHLRSVRQFGLML